jgi:DnaJ-class molecular chaperone
MFGSSLGASGEPRVTELSDVEVTIDCSLEEFYQGSLRSVEFERCEIEHNPKVSRSLKRSKQI